MKEWVLENTDIFEEEYDKLINPHMINMIEQPIVREEPKLCKLFSHPLIAINKFTLGTPNIFKQIKYNIRTEQNYYIHQDIKFYILAKILKNISPEIYEILYSNQRKGKCCELSIKIAAGLENCRVITAVCTNPFHEIHNEFLHTFLIYNVDSNNELVLDATLNAAIPKDSYYRLYQTKELSNITKEKLTNDMHIFNKANILNLNMAEYLCFPEQIAEAAKKLIRKKTIN